ncbi:transmembrane protein 163-like isoform X3 [Pseudoliparis swirei]|uniref:transmembrane protein 163-like isoform X3 n=1 Tax=Pseudoliparis swirei TaxID=2059687 RepID=UPI0024BE0289|nr:transmembrane protein 163-like isoform X3 [Pseudoliparis swirei]
MTDAATPTDPTAVADPVVVDPSPGEGLKMDQEMKITDSVEDGGLLESSMRLKPHEAQSYRKKVLWVSWVSIVITTLMAIAAFTVSVMRHSASAFGFAFNAVLDVLSSAIVLWRYRNAAAVHSAHREYIACVILGVVFILSSLCIMGKAIHDLATKLLPEVITLGRGDLFQRALGGRHLKLVPGSQMVCSFLMDIELMSKYKWIVNKVVSGFLAGERLGVSLIESLVA